MEITTSRLILFEVTWGDLEDIHRIHSIPEVDEFNTLGIPNNIEVTRENIQPVIDFSEGEVRKAYMWKILIKDTNEIIGIAGCSLSNNRFKLGEIYYTLIPEFWGNGYATEVCKAMITSGFKEFGLHKVEAGVATGNLASIRVLEKSGMTREGLRRKILPIRGEWKDNYHYAIVEDDPRDY